MMGEVKFQGIFSIETLYCGCKLKRFISGLNVIDPQDRSPTCENPKHRGYKTYTCRTCNKNISSHGEMKKHRWSHAI